MTEILHSQLQFPSNSSSITNNDGFHQQAFISPVATMYRRNSSIEEVETEEGSVLAVLVTVLRKSLVGCKNISVGVEEEQKHQLMEIGCPTNVRHVAHVTFDRFNGFLGLPVEFEPEVPRRPPSASTRVFGVSTQSMQLSFDTRGNCVPTILLMMQRRLYSQGGLQLEGIFRINPENGQEEYVREQLNNGLIPDNIDVHCLAGLIKAWFRELPSGILDCLSPDKVMHAKLEGDCAQLVRLLPPTEAALLDWAINLMADVAQLEHLNKMNARNIAMVFAPNMTQMSDPLTALMYAVQVMNFLKTLVFKTLREREDSIVESGPMLQLDPSDEDGHHKIPKRINLLPNEINEEVDQVNLADETLSSHTMNFSSLAEATTENKLHGFLNSIENILPERNGDIVVRSGGNQSRSLRGKTDQPSCSNNTKRGSRTCRMSKTDQPIVHVNEEKSKEINIISHVNASYTERAEAWR